jgi:hypothetical protein
LSGSTPSPLGAMLMRVDQLWLRLETRLAVWVLVTEVVTLSVWVSLKGLAADYARGGNLVGLIFRVVAGAIIGGLICYWPLRKRGPMLSRLAAFAGIGFGAVLGRLLVGAGTDWASNAVGWLQNASALMLIGGPRGFVTRLTLWVALLGGSIAAAKGKHINIDVATRYLPEKLVIPIAVMGWCLAALVCFAASFGFTDSIAVTKYRAEAFRTCESGEGLCDTGFGERLGSVAKGMSTDFFLLRKQLGLDLHTLPKVLVGTRYDTYLKAAEWNQMIEEGGWEAHFPADAVRGLKLSTDDPNASKMPAVVAPDTGEGRDLLIRDLNFILPFGLLVIGLKFLLRTLLVLLGVIKVEGGHGVSEGDVREAQA